MERNFSFLFDEEEDKPVKTTKIEKRESSSSQQSPLIREYSFVKPKRVKYLITIESKMNVAGIASENKVETRWFFTLKAITPYYYLFELIMLDNTMVETNNDGFVDIHKMVTQMQKALNEVVFQTNKQGAVIKVENIETIKQKWKSVKAEMFEYNKNMTSIQDLLKVNEKNFEEKGGVEQMVNEIEFFNVCINHLYGKKFPFYIKKTMPNFFRTTEFIIELDYENNKRDAHTNSIHFSGAPSLSKKDLEKAYGSFPFINLNAINPKINYRGDYVIDLQDGFVKSGEISYKEIVDPRLEAEIKYKIERYE